MVRELAAVGTISSMGASRCYGQRPSSLELIQNTTRGLPPVAAVPGQILPARNAPPTSIATPVEAALIPTNGPKPYSSEYEP